MVYILLWFSLQIKSVKLKSGMEVKDSCSLSNGPDNNLFFFFVFFLLLPLTLCKLHWEGNTKGNKHGGIFKVIKKEKSLS